MDPQGGPHRVDWSILDTRRVAEMAYAGFRFDSQSKKSGLEAHIAPRSCLGLQPSRVLFLSEVAR